jgi:hypothetical protein
MKAPEPGTNTEMLAGEASLTPAKQAFVRLLRTLDKLDVTHYEPVLTLRLPVK